MEKEMASEDLKARLLTAFVIICIALIGLIWADGLLFQQDAAAAPGYYRQAPEVDGSVYLTLTAEAVEFRQRITGTSTPQEHGAGQGQGSGVGTGTGSLDNDD
jgi:hypothetical protein